MAETQHTNSAQHLSEQVARLKHSLALAEILLDAKKRGISKRVAIKQLHFTDLRHSHGEEHSGSNAHVDRRRKREMRIRRESYHGQKMLRARARDIYEGELDTERITALNDIAYDFDFDAQLASTDSALAPDADAGEEQ